MNRFITRQNIKRFTALLATQPEGEERCKLERMLADEEARLRALELDGAALTPGQAAAADER